MTKKAGLPVLGVLLFAGVAAGVTMGGSAMVGAAQVTALSGVQPGQWQLKEIGGTAVRSVCIADVGQLIHLQPGASGCAHTMIDDGARAAVVNFSCSSGGSGRTTLTVRSPQALRVETQGMAGGAPFAFDYDARRTGDCAN